MIFSEGHFHICTEKSFERDAFAFYTLSLLLCFCSLIIHYFSLAVYCSSFVCVCVCWQRVAVEIDVLAADQTE